VSKNSKNSDIVIQGPVTAWQLRGKVWKLAWPTIGEQCLNLLVGLADVYFLGHLSATAITQLGYGSAEALTAGSLGNFFTWVAFVVYSAMSVPATTLVARAYGAKNRAEAAYVARQSMLLGLILGILVGVLIHFNAENLIRAFGATGKVAEIGAQYLEFTSFGMPLWSLMVVGSACLRGSGDTRTPLLVVMLINLINIASASILVNGNLGIPVLGIKGAAISAATAWTVGALIVTIRLFKKPNRQNLDALYLPLGFKIDFKTVKDLLKLGLPTMGEQIAFQIAIFFFARMVVDLGTVKYAAHNAIITIDSISFLPGIGFGIAATVLVGQCLGAGRPDLAERYAITAYQLGLVFMTVMGLSFVLFPEFFLGMLVNDQEVVKAAADPLRIAGFFDPLLATVFILMGALRGAGDTRFPLYGRIISSCFVRVSLGYLFIVVLEMGLFGVRLAMGLDSVVLAALIIWRFKSGRWKSVLKSEPSPSTKLISVQASPSDD
jgi:putative MATE family efflux protein